MNDHNLIIYREPRAIKVLFDSNKGYSYNFTIVELWSTSSPFCLSNLLEPKIWKMQ